MSSVASWRLPTVHGTLLFVDDGAPFSATPLATRSAARYFTSTVVPQNIRPGVTEMISSLHIRNFKSIANAQLEFGRVNLLVGANGSGKTNLLEALGLYAACLGRGITADVLSAKGVRLSAPRIFKSSFKKRPTPASIYLDGVIAAARYTVALRTKPRSSNLAFRSEALIEDSATVLSRRLTTARMTTPSASLDTDPHRGLWDTHGSTAHVTPATRAALNAVAQYVIYAPQTAVMRGLVPDNRGLEPLGLTGSRLPQAFMEVLEQATDSSTTKDINEILNIIWKPGWAQSVGVGPPKKDVLPSVLPPEKESIYIVDKYMQTNRNTLSPYDASEGTLFLLFVATILAHTGSPAIFALDNVDGTLNPSMVRALVGHIVTVACRDGSASGDDATADNERPQQVFLTSHNPTALDALDLFEPEQRLFVVSRNKDGHTVFERVQPPAGMTKDQWVTAKGGRNLSQLWLDGRIARALG